MHYLLFYDVADDYVERRTPFRAAHLKQIREAFEHGELVLAGALADPVDGAVLVFRDAAAAGRFAATDPYVLNGAVKSWRIRNWNTVLGDGALAPRIEPASDKTRTPGRPDPSEYSAEAAIYVDLVEGGDILRAFEEQLADALTLLQPLTAEAAQSAYAPGKWTVKEVLGHVIDTERIFTYRALRVARGDATPLPGVETDDYMEPARFNTRPLGALLQEFRVVREATLALFRNLPADAWMRRGTVNNYSATVRGLAFTSAGHERHHVKILREKYLNA
jgi:uncharacterized protein YciI